MNNCCLQNAGILLSLIIDEVILDELLQIIGAAANQCPYIAKGTVGYNQPDKHLCTGPKVLGTVGKVRLVSVGVRPNDSFAVGKGVVGQLVTSVYRHHGVV